MSSDDEVTMPNEIVIVRRRPSGDGDGHHGGAWKIAYADFMTAMMAFFLVMWLINASDDKTIAQVASYFNPIKLNDRVRSTKGLNDADEKSEQKGEGTKKEKHGSTDKDNDKVNDDLAEGSEQDLFADPYGLLAKLATKAEKDFLGRGPLSDDESRGVGGGATHRDPFAPDFHRGAPAAGELRLPAKKGVLPDKKALAVEETDTKAAKANDSPAQKADAVVVSGPSDSSSPSAAEAKKVEREIREALRALSPGRTPFIEVRKTPEGLLVSLTDQFDFGMFNIASAKPRAELVIVMDRLAKVISRRKEKLVVRGHTDGLPFRSKDYDNWRLATARAHMARYMLVRGGIDEARFERVEGYADRMLRVPGNPLAAQNRRIEILLRSEKP